MATYIAASPPPKRQLSSMPTGHSDYEFMVVVLSTLNPLNVLSFGWGFIL